LNRIKSIVIILLTLAAGIASAQHLSRSQRFRVDYIKGCVPLTVTITDANLQTPPMATPECTPGKPCLMDFEGNGAQRQNLFTFTYNTPGTYRLSLLYQSIGADDITITVLPNTQPPFEIYSCANNRVSVQVMDNKYEQYLIDFNNDGTPESVQPFTNTIVAQHNYGVAGNYTIAVRGRNTQSRDNCTAATQNFTARTTLAAPSFNTLTALDANSLRLDFSRQNQIQQRIEIAVNNASNFQVFQRIYEKDTHTATSLRVDDNYYCFRVGAYDPCANSSQYSGIMCSQNFDLTIQNRVNKLAWATAATGVNSTTIQRDRQDYTTIPGAPMAFDDTNIICKTNYCYKVINNYGGGHQSISLEKCGTSFNIIQLNGIENNSAVVTDPGADLSWVVDPNATRPVFTLYRSVLGLPFGQIAKTPNGNIADADYTTGSKSCYRVDYADYCDNPSPAGRPFCPIRLAGELGDKNIVTINWSEFDGWKDGVNNYVVEKYNKSGVRFATVDVGLSTSYVDDPPDEFNQLIRYRVQAVARATGINASLSNTVEVIKKSSFFSPTAFTPNTDQLNDTFRVSGQYITKVSIKVFDRWGGLIFTSNGESWNGTRSGTGQLVPSGTYVWKANVTNQAGQDFTEEGTVLLIRP
jgi:gliding motility-associated-like protein